MRLSLQFLLPLFLVFAACGDDGSSTPAEDTGSDTGSDNGSDTGSGAGSGITFPASKLVGATGCALDEECDPGKFCFLGACAAQCTADDQCSASSCSARGKCEQTTNRLNKAADGAADAAPAGDRLVGISLYSVGGETVYVAAGQTSVTVTVVTSGPVLAKGGLAYRIDTTSAPSLATVVTVSPGDTVHYITFPAGASDPALEEPHVEQVYVTTNAGAFPLKLVPKRGVGGRYTADAIIPALGARLPIGFSIVTVPENASIQDAQSIYLVMNAENTEILAPVAAANAVVMAGPTGPTAPTRLGVAAPVGRIGTTQYSAQFDNGFEIPAGELFGGAPASQTQRSLRFEFVVEDDGRIAGTFTDTWRGLYNQAAADHTETVGTVQLEGEFVASRVGPPPPSTNILALRDVSVLFAPALRTYPIDSACDDVFSAVPSCTTAPQIVTAACANDLKATANTGESLTKIVADLFEGGETSGGASFSEFLAQCAAETAGACVPTVEVKCAAQAAAIALRTTPSGPSAAADKQWQNYTDLLLQLTGGPQLKAYYLDVEARKTWLRRSQAADSDVTAAALKTLNEELMRDWLRDVVDANIESLQVTLQPATYAFMSRAADSTVSIDERDRLLISMVNAWGTAADSLGLAALRYSELYRLDSERAAKRDLVAKRTRELYMSAIVIIQLHQAAGKAAQAASIATGLGALLERQSLLSNTFDELLFARDGEVVISTSVDPNDTSNDVLGARRERAIIAIRTARTSVEGTLATIFSQQLSFGALLGAANDAVDASQDRMIELCGIPDGCVPSDLGDAACDTSPAAGLCGFKQTRGDYETRAETMISTAKEVIAQIEAGPSEGLQIVNLWESAEESPSEAGLALLAYRAAAQDYAGAMAEQREATNARTAESNAIDAFRVSINGILTARKAQNIAVMAAMAVVKGNADTKVSDRLALVESAIDKRTALLAIRSATMVGWQYVNLAGSQVQIAALTAANAAEDVAAVAENAADLAANTRDGGIEALPTMIGPAATDPSAPARAAISTSANTGIAASENAKVAARSAARKATLAVETAAIIKEGTLAAIDNASEFAALAVETDLAIADIYGEFEILQNDVAQSNLDIAVDELDRLADYEVLVIEQQIELRDRTAALLDRTIDDLGHSREVAQAELSMLAALLNYHAVVSSARQERANLEGVRSKKIALNNTIGGPERFMTDASKLAEADRQIDRAKRKLNDWLVALEYFAVRPFFNERMAIALAKSSYELEKISARLDDLQGGCGGSLSSSVSEVSVRSDLLGYRESIVDAVTLRTLSPADRFQETLKRGVVPVNQRTRYTASDSLGSLLQSRGVLSASFVVALGDFANLAVTCNAKVKSVAIKLEGEGIGSGQPVVTLLYEGSSQLYSCQPGISDYVAEFGQNSTAFDTVTTFQITGRSSSPVAGINVMGSSNNSFSGLPLASRYTVLIDPSLPANKNIVWSKVTDIKLGLTYDYQDPFPSDSLCGSR